MEELRLIALDAEDLRVLSAQLQDAVLKVEDLAYLPKERRFAMLANRFNWAGAFTGKQRDRRQYTRHRCAVRFEQVGAARVQGIDLDDAARVLSLLAIDFEPNAEGDPSGNVTMIFAGGAAIRLEVAYIEAELRDLGAVWAAASKPEHPGADPSSAGGN